VPASLRGGDRAEGAGHRARPLDFQSDPVAGTNRGRVLHGAAMS